MKEKHLIAPTVALYTPPLNPKLMPPKLPFASFWILICGPHDSPDLKFQLGLLGKIDFFAIFVFLLVDFHSARLFFAMYGAFLGIFWVGLGIGDEQGSIFSFSTF